MKHRASLILVLVWLPCALLLGCKASSPEVTEQGTVRKPAFAPYGEVADRLVEEILSLRTNQAFLAELKLVEDSGPKKIWRHFQCSHGVIGQRLNPSWTPHAKVPKNLPVFADDGVEVVVYIHLGTYPGAAARPMTNVIGDLNVTMFTAGPKARVVQDELERIIAEVRNHFTKNRS